MKAEIRILILVFSVFLIQTGCTGLQTFPVAARAGDTVTIALGSYDNMTASNIVVEFLPNGVLPGFGTALTPRSVFRLYADRTSTAYNDPTFLLGGVIQKAGHAPWLNVLVVDLPTSLNTGTTPIDGQIFVDRAGGAGTPPVYPGHGTDLPDFWDDPAINIASEDNIKIALTVLPTGLPETDTGAPGVFQYELGGFYSGNNLPSGIVVNGNLPSLEPLPHAIVTPPFDGDPSAIYTNTTYGAVEITLTLAAETTGGSPVNLDPLTHNSSFRVIADNMQAYTNSRRSVAYNLTGINQLSVMLISPEGKLKYFEPRISILFSPLSGLRFTSPPVVSNVIYYDINGVVVNAPIVPASIEYSSEIRS